MAVNTEVWFQRGDALKCFSNRLQQARYFSAWSNSELNSVLYELERIFTRNSRAIGINWLNQPELLNSLAVVNDIPPLSFEDWEDSIFSINIPGGKTVHPSWLLKESAWLELLTAVTRRFLFFNNKDKHRILRSWYSNLQQNDVELNLSLDILSISASRAEFLRRSKSSSLYVKTILGDADDLEYLEQRFRERATNALNAWVSVLGPESKILTLTRLRNVEHMLDLETLLTRCTTPTTANLMTYLQCKDYTL